MKVIAFYKNILAENSVWIYRAGKIALLFFIIGVLTYLAYPELLQDLLAVLDEVFADLLGEEDPALDFRTALLIFRNNFEVALLMMALGIVLGMFPFLSISFNFFIIGFLYSAFSFTSPFPGEVTGSSIFFASIVPHAVFELPAFLIAAGMGLRLGFFWKRPPGVSCGRNILAILKQDIQLVPLLGLLFFAAAVVEVFVSGNIVSLIVSLLEK